VAGARGKEEKVACVRLSRVVLDICAACIGASCGAAAAAAAAAGLRRLLLLLLLLGCWLMVVNLQEARCLDLRNSRREH
jgi:hypothetical protein